MGTSRTITGVPDAPAVTRYSITAILWETTFPSYSIYDAVIADIANPRKNWEALDDHEFYDTLAYHVGIQTEKSTRIMINELTV